MSHPTRDDGGAIAVLVVAFSLVMFGFAAIVVDLGVARVTQTEAQTAADAATLAGAGALYNEPNLVPLEAEAVMAVKHIAFANYLSSQYKDEAAADAAWSACPAPPTTDPKRSWAKAAGNSECIRVGPGTPPSQLWVRMPSRRTGVFFGGLLGYSGMDVTATSTAQARESSLQACSLCIHGFLKVAGTVRVEGDGSIVADDADVDSGGNVSVGGIGSIGFASTPDPPGGPRYSKEPVVPVLPQDPFDGAAMPGPLPTNNLTSEPPCTSGVIDTAKAFKDLTIDGPCSVANGTLVVTGTLHVTSQGSLQGSAATVFLTCSSSNNGAINADLCSPTGGAGGSLVIDDGGSVDLVNSAVTAGVNTFALLSDRNNTSQMQANGQLVVTGANVYARRVKLTSTGSKPVVGLTDGLLSVGALTVDSGAVVTVATRGLSSQPGTPRIALVE